MDLILLSYIDTVLLVVPCKFIIRLSAYKVAELLFVPSLVDSVVNIDVPVFACLKVVPKLAFSTPIKLLLVVESA